jgi:tetrathionate reductase subunit B
VPRPGVSPQSEGRGVMAKVMIIDITKCNGCYNCQIACKDEHVGNDWSPIAKPQPDTGQFWMRNEDIVRGQVPKVKISYMHHICQHCDDAPCIAACKSKAVYKREDGAVIIDPTRCTGQRNCLAACPYGAIYYNEGLQLAQKCTWCAHLLDEGWKEPRCVDACPTAALKFGEESEFADLIARAEILNLAAAAAAAGADAGAPPKVRVYYLGIPKRFIAGSVYDPAEDECLEGVAVTLTDATGAPVASLQTDSFGDFWFEGLPVGTFSLAFQKAGYLRQSLGNVSTEKDINVGDIELLPEGR